MATLTKIDLTEYDIVAIWEASEAAAEIAKCFAVSENIVNLIKAGKYGSEFTKSLIRSKPKNEPKYNPHKLLPEQVLYIINSSKSNSELCKEFGVARNTICDIRLGRSWKQYANLPRTRYKSIKGIAGETHGHAVLTELQVRKILTLLPTHSNRTLSKLFKVAPSTISSIRRGKTWVYLTGGKKQVRSMGLKGSKHPGAKLNETIVKEIRTSNLSVRQLAKKFNVSRHTIQDVKNNKSWLHVSI
jgi:transposase